jgi:hypothetical protein
MGEIVSEDMLDWARDLAAIQRLLRGEELDQPVEDGAVLTLNFGGVRACDSVPRPPTAPQSPLDIRQASA